MAWVEKTVSGAGATSIVVFYGGPMPIEVVPEAWDQKEVVKPPYLECTVTPSAATPCTVPPSTWTPKQV